jgi:acetyl-CoA C-acetyltransferase
MESIKDKVAVIGVGCTKFGELWDKSASDLVIDAAYEAFEDAGIEPRDIQAAWVGTVNSGESSLTLTIPLKTQNIPVTRVENICVTGMEAFRGACYAVAAGVCDIALAVGVEKLKDTFGLMGAPGTNTPYSQMGVSGNERLVVPASLFGLMATRYFHHYGLSVEEGRKTLARIPIKNHNNASMNPKAHFQNKITMEQVLNSPMISWPLSLFDCCGYSDGCAAAIITRADMAKNFRKDPIYVKALSLAVGARQPRFIAGEDYVHTEQNIIASKAAYQDAGITNPLKQLSMAELHDCFSIHELVTYEDLGFCPRGAGKEYLEGGAFDLGGDLPVNTDGGLKCFGHPLGASGLRMVYEVIKQLQGKAGPRQVKNPQLGLLHNLGGGPYQGISMIGIFGN